MVKMSSTNTTSIRGTTLSSKPPRFLVWIRNGSMSAPSFLGVVDLVEHHGDAVFDLALQPMHPAFQALAQQDEDDGEQKTALGGDQGFGNPVGQKHGITVAVFGH